MYKYNLLQCFKAMFLDKYIDDHVVDLVTLYITNKLTI